MGVLSNGCKLGIAPSALNGLVACVNNNCTAPSPADCGHGCGFHHRDDDEDDTIPGLPDHGSQITDAVRVLLHGLGEDVSRDGIIKTPLRVARAFAFATKGYRQDAQDIIGDALFPEAGVEPGFGFAGGFGGMVVVRNIDLYSLCESCLIPFKVCCHIAYISSGYQVVGLSKLPRVADMYARRLQNPQSLAEQICQGLTDAIKPLGAAIVMQCWHLPVPGFHHDIDGSRSLFSEPITAFSGKGQFGDSKSDAWVEFLAMLQLEGVSVNPLGASESNGSIRRVWCPCLSQDSEKHPAAVTAYSNGSTRIANCSNGVHNNSSSSSMVNAVETILKPLVMQGTQAEDLHHAAKCFTRWFLNFKRKEEFEVNAKPLHSNGVLSVTNRHDRISANGSSVSMNGHNKICVNGTLSNRNGHLNSATNGPAIVDITMDIVPSSGLCVELEVPFCSLCEHHLLPFFGRAHVGYLGVEGMQGVINRSAVLDIVKTASLKLQVQERLSKEIAEAIKMKFKLQSIIVVLEASHVCMISRGVEKLGSSTVTIAVFGHFATNVLAKAEFLRKISANRSVSRNCI